MGIAAKVVDGYASGTGATLTLNKPSGGWNAGSTLILALFTAAAGGTIPTPSGWTAVDTQAPYKEGVGVFSLALAAAGPASYSFSMPATNTYLFGVIAEYSSAQTAGVDTATGTIGSAGTITWPAVTTANANEIVILVGGGEYIYPTTTPTGYTVEITAGETAAVGYSFFDATQASAGSTGSPTATSNGTAAWGVITVALLPPSGGGATTIGLSGGTWSFGGRAFGADGYVAVQGSSAAWAPGPVAADGDVGLTAKSQSWASGSPTLSGLANLAQKAAAWAASSPAASIGLGLPAGVLGWTANAVALLGATVISLAQKAAAWLGYAFNIPIALAYFASLPGNATNPISGFSIDPNGVPRRQPGQQSSAINITGPQVVKASAGRIGWLVIESPGTAGAWTVSDSATLAGSAAANEIFSLPYGSPQNVEGARFRIQWPCVDGITVSSVPTGGVANLSFD